MLLGFTDLCRRLAASVATWWMHARAGSGGEGVVRNVPALEHPILLFLGNSAPRQSAADRPSLVRMLEDVPSWKVIEACSLADFRAKLTERPYAILIALSPPDASGTAGVAIAEFRAANPRGVTVYHGWDYRLAISGPRALACQADALMVGGTLAEELICLLGTMVLVKRRYAYSPSIRGYETILRQACPRSGFWQMQDTILPECTIE